MALAWSRYSALIYAIVLALFELYVHSAQNWELWPLWTIDYAIVVWLIYAFVRSRNPSYCHSLTTAWTFALGVFYMSFFAELDAASHGVDDRPGIVIVGAFLTLLGTLIAAVGALTAAYAQRVSRGAPAVEPTSSG